MNRPVCLGMLLFLLCSAGCRKAAPVNTAPMIETYSIQAKQNQLVVGENQKVEITVRYDRSEQPAAKLKYKVQFSARGDLTVAPTSWDVEHDLTTNDAGYNYTGLISIEVPANAAPGEREVTVTIIPTQGATSTSTLKFQIAKKGG